MKIKNIIWETDEFDADDLMLPTEVELPTNIDADDDDAINNFLSDKYGWLVINYRVVSKYEVYGINDEVIKSTDDITEALACAETNEAKFVLDTDNEKVVWGKTDD